MAGGVKSQSGGREGPGGGGQRSDATQMGDAVKLLASLAAMQAQQDPAAARWRSRCK